MRRAHSIDIYFPKPSTLQTLAGKMLQSSHLADSPSRAGASFTYSQFHRQQEIALLAKFIYADTKKTMKNPGSKL